MDPLEDVAGAEGGGGEGIADKKKKKKKKPATDKEKGGKDDKSSKDKKPVRKGPSQKTIAAIQEAIQKAKDEEDRQLREEDEKERLREEAEDARLEKLRLEQEKKDRKKLKEKEKKERLKAEGKFLTPKQKLEKQRAQDRLESLKAQGVELPTETGSDKKPRLGTRIRKKQSLQSEASASIDGSTNDSIELPEPAEPVVKDDNESSLEEQVEEQVEEEVIKEEWDQESSGDDDKDDDNSKENTLPESPTKKAPKTDTKTSKRTRNTSGKSKSSESENGKINSSNEDTESNSDSSEDSESEHVGETKKEKALHRIQKRREENENARSLKHLRSPVVCVLGHVDTGKTKILDKLRRTNVQDGEAGGITQQIGATNVPIDAIREQSRFVKDFSTLELKIPGLLIIDTPGHESFSNLRSRGSSLCDIAILVVDIMHGLEPQTIESINLLKLKKTPFVVALNKIDRLYEWCATGAKKDIRDIIAGQPKNTSAEFEKKTKETIAEFALQGLNTALLGQNPDPKTYITMVPTSALTGEGMGNLMALIVELSQTMIAKQLMYSNELVATVLEVKALPGLGTTIDLVLLNGKMAEGDTLILAGSDGPIVTQIRSLLTPQPMKELRVKNTYIEYKEISGAVGVKLAAKDLEKAIAGLNVLIAHHPDEIEICKEEVTKELKSALSSFRLQERGVYVQASTLGSLEALLEFLRTSEIPYSGIRIGPVVKKDVMRASTMLEHDGKYAVILAFDVKIERDAQELADSAGVRIFQADIIYHLFDKFIAYRDELKNKQRDEFKHLAVFPCKIKILPQCIFKTRDPIIVGVMVEAGIVKEGTPLCVQNATTSEVLQIGRVSSIESNHKAVDTAKKGQEVCIKIEPIPGDSPKMLGRHFLETDILVSKVILIIMGTLRPEPLLTNHPDIGVIRQISITRESIDVCKEYFRADLQKSDWALMVELKKMFQIM